MSQLNELRKHLRSGAVYRRADLLAWSNAVDRHLRELQSDGTLMKLSGGVYYCPQKTAFGVAPADDKTLVKAFLKDHRFLLTSPNSYNTLGVGTTQLYNETIVYNHKRHGHFTLGGRKFDFRIKPHFPLKPNTEFLLVDLVDNVERLAEDKEAVLTHVAQKVPSFDAKTLLKAANTYGGVRTRKFFSMLLEYNEEKHAA